MVNQHSILTEVFTDGDLCVVKKWKIPPSFEHNQRGAGL